MTGENSSKIYAEKNRIEEIINYFNKYGVFRNATIDLSEGKTAKIQPYEGRLEIISNDPDVINELRNILKND